MKIQQEKFGDALLKAMLIIGIGGISNLIYSIFLAIEFNLDIARTLSNLTFSYILISSFPLLVILIGIRKYDFKNKKPNRKLFAVVFPTFIILIFIGIHTSFQTVPSSPKYALAGLLSSLSVVFGLFAGFACSYVFHKVLYGDKPLFKHSQE